MAGNPAGKRELREQLLEPGFVLADVWINLAPRAFEVNVGHNCRAPVTGTGDVEHIQVILLDDPVQVHVNEVLARRRAPVSDHQRLHVRQLQRLSKQGVVVEIDLADGQVISGPPVGIDLAELFRRKWDVAVRRLRLQFRGGPGSGELFRRKSTLLDFEFRHRLAPSSDSVGVNSWMIRNYDGRAVRRAAALAIINSSSVRMTRTLTGPWSVEIRRALDALRPSSKVIPRNSSPAQI